VSSGFIKLNGNRKNHSTVNAIKSTSWSSLAQSLHDQMQRPPTEYAIGAGRYCQLVFSVFTSNRNATISSAAMFWIVFAVRPK
jgi:hypothetical protein